MKSLNLSKTLFIIMLMSFSFMGYSRGEEPLPPISEQQEISTAERLIDKYTAKIAESMTKIAKQIGKTASNTFNYVENVLIEGFKYLVRYQIAKGLIHISPMFVAIIFYWIWNSERKRLIKLMESKSLESVWNIRVISTKYILFLLGMVAMFFVSLETVPTGILYLVAPEWYALQDAIKLIESLK